MQFLFMTLLLMTSIFLVLLVLVQRGRGGGLTGALGGMGGQSAFGSKAGDLFTRITIGVAAFWIILSVVSIKVLNTPPSVLGDTDQTTFDNVAPPSLVPAGSSDSLEIPADSSANGDSEAAAMSALSEEPDTEETPAESAEPAPAEDASAAEPPADDSAAVATPEKDEATPAKEASSDKDE